VRCLAKEAKLRVEGTSQQLSHELLKQPSAIYPRLWDPVRVDKLHLYAAFDVLADLGEALEAVCEHTVAPHPNPHPRTVLEIDTGTIHVLAVAPNETIEELHALLERKDKRDSAQDPRRAPAVLRL